MTPQEHQERIKAQILGSYNIQKSEDSDIEKGGEGSKGGHVVGHTKSGKPIYDSFEHEGHKDFTKQDHYDAAFHHEHEAVMHEFGYDNTSDPINRIHKKGLMDHHRANANKHMASSK